MRTSIAFAAAALVAALVRPALADRAPASRAPRAAEEMRRQALDAQLAPWREAALTEFQHAIEIARAHPELTNNPAVASALRDSEQRLASEVAAR